MVSSYWEIGRLIVEHEQQGQARAAYGQRQLAELSARLTELFGRGFDERYLRHMRAFFLCFPIRDAVRSEWGWTHYRILLRVENPSAREWYLREAISQNWSSRALERQIEKLAQQKRRRELEGKRDNLRRESYARQDEIEAQRDALIEQLEGRLEQRTQESTLFTIEWELK
jgi:hypothetical protein